MKLAILGNLAPTYVRPMAEGLQRMFADINVTAEFFHDGHLGLTQVQPDLWRYLRSAKQGSTIKNALKYFIKEAPRFYPFVTRLRQFDAIVVVNSAPGAFLADWFRDEALRYWLPKTPIVLYDVYYMATRGPWLKWLKEGNPEKGVMRSGNWGLERYDWYLVSSVVSECPLPKGNHPYSLIGINFADGSLRVEPKKEFTALIDFEFPEHISERAIQILACEKANVRYVVLHGRYSKQDIQAIYRQSSIYFLSHRESFGLPICELQACGSYIFTPYSNWCPSHWIKGDLAQPGSGDLSPNFIVYNNDFDRLISEIDRVKSGYDPYEVVNRFHSYHPELYFGNLKELEKFVQMIESGKITSRSHEQYAGIKCDYSGPFG